MNNLFNKVRAGAQRLAGGLRPQPVQFNEAAVTRPAAAALEAYDPVLIEASDFKATGKPFDASGNEWNPIAEFKIQPGTQYEIALGERYRLYLKTVKAVAGANAAAANRTRNAPGIIDSKLANPALPTLYHPEVVVWCLVGAVWQKATITAIVYGAAGTVSYDEPANCTNVEIRYLAAVGEWRYRVGRALGYNDNSTTGIVNNAFSTTHTVDQSNLDTAGKWPTPVTLVPGQSLLLEVKSTDVYDWSPRNENLLEIPSRSRQILVADKRTLARYAEVQARNGV